MAVVRYNFYSDVLGEQVTTHVILPSLELWRDREGGEAYYGNYGLKKTLYLLHGGSDDSSLYIRRTRIEEYAFDYDLAVVMPEVRNSFYSNMILGKKYFDFLSEELPKVMESTFPLTHNPEERFVIGNSMGAHGALKWALNRPEFFKAASGMSGAGDLEELGFYSGNKVRVLNSFGTLEQYRGSMNDFKFLINKHLSNGTRIPAIHLCCGSEDGFYDGAKLFYDFLIEKGVNATFHEAPGAHCFEYWDRMLPIMLKKMIG